MLQKPKIYEDQDLIKLSPRNVVDFKSISEIIQSESSKTNESSIDSEQKCQIKLNLQAQY